MSLLRGLVRWLRGWLAPFVGAEPPRPASRLPTLVDDARLEHQQQIAEYNRALAVAVNLEGVIRLQAESLEAQQRALRTQLEAALEQGADEAGAQHALRLEEVTAELAERRRCLEEASKTVAQLTQARHEAIAEATGLLKRAKGAVEAGG